MRPIHTLFGIRLHWGEPHFRTKVRAYTGSLRSMKQRDEAAWSNCFTDHEIVRWYGLSFSLNGFFGWQRFGETTWPRENGPRPYSSEEQAA